MKTFHRLQFFAFYLTIAVAAVASESQIHIKARFLAVPKGTVAGLGNFLNSTNSADGQFTGILNEATMRTILHSLESRKDVETLAEPEVVSTSGRQTQMRATTIETEEDVVFDVVVKRPGPVKTGPFLDVVPYVLSDGYMINLTVISSPTEIMGYDQPTNSPFATNSARVTLPKILPRFSAWQVAANLNLYDGQTVVLGKMHDEITVGGKKVDGKPDSVDKDLLVFITVTLVHPAGNRIHSDEELPFAKDAVPPQPK